ncbi:MAG TPA: histidine triad nucleotide-binding protein [bacterium]|nr:histidine triad nucleotide-binding protein [bacterium]
MPDDCLFCKIIAGTIPSETVYEDGVLVAFKDVHPIAPVHVLIVPREHVESVNGINESNQNLMGDLFAAAARLARELGVADDGYRCVINTNREAGQVVFHLHLHLIGGRPLHGLG